MPSVAGTRHLRGPCAVTAPSCWGRETYGEGECIGASQVKWLFSIYWFLKELKFVITLPLSLIPSDFWARLGWGRWSPCMWSIVP